MLGPEGVGQYSYSYSVASYFAMFAILGMSTHGVRAIASCGTDRACRSKVFWAAYVAQVSVGALAFIAYPLLIGVFGRGGDPVWFVWTLYVLASALDVTWLFFGVQEFRLPTMRSIAIKVATVASIFLFVHSESDLWLYCLILAVGALSNQLLLWMFVGKYVDACRPPRKEVFSHLRSSAILFIPVIATSFYTVMDKVVLGAMAGAEQTGFYEYSQKLSSMPLALITAIGTVMLPRMAEEFGKGNRSEAIRLLSKSIWVMLAAAFALAFGIASIAPEFAFVFLGEQYASCWVAMVIISFTVPAISMTNVLGRQFLIPSSRDGQYSASVWGGAGINLLLNVILVPSMGANGSAIATVCAEYSVLVIQAMLVRRDLPLASYLRNALPFALMGVAMMLVVRLVATCLNSVWGMSVMGLIMEVGIGAFVYLALFLTWGSLTKNADFAWLKSSLLNQKARISK